MTDQQPTQDHGISGPRGPYTATPPTNAAQAAQELAHLESSPRNPDDRIQQAEMAALRRIASGGKQQSHRP